MYRKLLKRLIDFIAALTGIAFVLPFCLLIFPLVSFSNGGPVFFVQTRPGKKGILFRLLKLKTMNDKEDNVGRLLPDSVRLTRIGRLIRSLSLDELPQLFNVLKGDMSFVGPRPLLYEYLPLYTEFQTRRHEVRPGITGWAQINGRNAISWGDKFTMDVWYVDNMSFSLDIKILLITLVRVLKREGINSTPEVTMERFTGKIER